MSRHLGKNTDEIGEHTPNQLWDGGWGGHAIPPLCKSGLSTGSSTNCQIWGKFPTKSTFYVRFLPSITQPTSRPTYKTGFSSSSPGYLKTSLRRSLPSLPGESSRTKIPNQPKRERGKKDAIDFGCPSLPDSPPFTIPFLSGRLDPSSLFPITNRNLRPSVPSGKQGGELKNKLVCTVINIGGWAPTLLGRSADEHRTRKKMGRDFSL